MRLRIKLPSMRCDEIAKVANNTGLELSSVAYHLVRIHRQIGLNIRQLWFSSLSTKMPSSTTCRQKCSVFRLTLWTFMGWSLNAAIVTPLEQLSRESNF